MVYCLHHIEAVKWILTLLNFLYLVLICYGLGFSCMGELAHKYIDVVFE